MAQKKITDLQLRSDFDETCNIPVDDSTQTWRVTGAQMKEFIGDEIAPLTTKGDLLAFGASAPQRVAGNTSATPAILTQTGDGTNSAVPVWRSFKAPTIQKFTSTGTGTYTTPAGVLYIRVRAIGAGGGGGAAISNSGSDGGATYFRVGASPDLIVANGGIGALAGQSYGGVGGSASLGGLIGTAIAGSDGGGGSGNVTGNESAGGYGGVGFFGGAGAGGPGHGSPGTNGKANSGSGGGGGGGQSGQTGGAGGGAGGYVEALILTPSATYAYNVGAGGTGGSGSGSAGGTGGSGYIEVTEFYQ